jgi:HK97 family phage major capsid protein
MNFIKKLKALLAKGVATAEEKLALRKEFEELDADTQEVAKDDLEAVENLSEGEDVQEEVEKAIKSLFASEKGNILKEVQSILDEHKAKKEKQVGAYSPEAQKDAKRKTVNKFLREGMLSVIKGNATEEFEAVRKEMTSDDSGTPFAGFITDDFLSAEIRHLQTEYGVAAREFTTVSFMQKSYKANNLATDVSVFWVDEAGSISSTQAVLGQKSLELKKLAAIVTLTRELLQEQEVDFVSFLGSRVAEGFAKAEDEAFFIGDGTSTYGSFTGLLEDTDVNEVTQASGDTSFDDITVEYLRSMQDATPQGALANAKYYMNRTILSKVRNLRENGAQGAFIYKSPQGNEPANIDGYPVVLVEAMPKGTDDAVDTSYVLFGDLRKATIRGIRGGIVADRFNAGAVRNVADNADINLITTDREAVRWISQVGYIAIIPTAVTRLTTAAS